MSSPLSSSSSDYIPISEQSLQSSGFQDIDESLLQHFESTRLFRLFGLMQDSFQKQYLYFFAICCLIYAFLNSWVFYDQIGQSNVINVEIVILNLALNALNVYLIFLAKPAYKKLLNVLSSTKHPSKVLQQKLRKDSNMIIVLGVFLVFASMLQDIAVTDSLLTFFNENMGDDDAFSVVMTSIYILLAFYINLLSSLAICVYFSLLFAHRYQILQFSAMLSSPDLNFDTPELAARHHKLAARSLDESCEMYQFAITYYIGLSLLFFVDFSLHTVFQILRSSNILSLASFWTSAFYNVCSIFIILTPGALVTQSASQVQSISASELIEENRTINSWFLLYIRTTHEEFCYSIYGYRVTRSLLVKLLIFFLPVLSFILRLLASNGDKGAV